MKRSFLWVLAVLLVLPGCFGRKDKKEPRKGKKKTEMHAEVDIPVVDEEIKSFFDKDVEEFALLEGDEEELDEDSLSEELELLADLDIDDDEDVLDEDLLAGLDIDMEELEALKQAAADELDDDFFWIEDVDESQDSFKNVYFDFDKHEFKEGQEEYVAQNIELAKKLIDQGESPTITIEGHACASAGSRSYNIAISNNRAEVVASRFVANGVPRESIKIVGRGQDVPVIDEEGKPVTGDRKEQWPNRRVEIKVYS